jgi:capsular polysaccharide transport system ATP-binding protein
MIELKNVTKYYHTHEGRKYILQDVSLTLPNVNIGILGRNGSGKSTLMRILGQIEFPNRGKIISSSNFSWPLALGGGFVGTMTGKANVKFVCRLYGKNRAETNEIIAFVKEFTELEEYFHMPIKTYSTGMRARLGFGLSLAFDFDYLLIDETLSVGDINFRNKAYNALRKKMERCHILLVSHHMKILSELCQEGILVHEGKLYHYEKIDDAIKHYRTLNQNRESR